MALPEVTEPVSGWEPCSASAVHALNHYPLLLFCTRKKRWSGILWHLRKHGGHAGEGRDGSIGAFTERRAA